MKTNHSTFLQRPRIEGCHIQAWLGFKHLMYLMEESVLDFFRQNGFSQRELIINYGIKLKLTYSKIEIISVVNSDDLLEIDVALNSLEKQSDFTVKAYFSDKKVAFKGEVDVYFDDSKSVKELPDYLKRFSEKPKLSDEIKNYKISDFTDLDNFFSSLDQYDNFIIWIKKIPYFYCNYRYELAHSGYIRLIEEVVDVFLDKRNLQIKKMLTTKDWIPFVANASIRIYQPAFMDEEVISVFSISRIFKDCIYTAVIDFYIIRENDIIHIAKSNITHGYTHIRGMNDWEMVTFDEDTIKAIKNE